MISDLFYKNSVPNFKQNKQLIVDSVKRAKNLHIVSDTENHYTDYHISKDLERVYEPVISGYVCNHMRNFQENFNFKGISLHALWFQWYPENGFHDWHVHPYCHFTNVFYVDLPSTDVKTEIKDINGNSIEVSVSEGDILTFPAFLLHRSPITNKEKIVIAFNTNIL
jgi:hypothetical protein